MKPSHILPSILILLLAGGFFHLSAQGFPFDDFRPRTMAEIIRQNIEVQKESMKGVQSKQQMIIDADPQGNAWPPINISHEGASCNRSTSPNLRHRLGKSSSFCSTKRAMTPMP